MNKEQTLAQIVALATANNISLQEIEAEMLGSSPAGQNKKEGGSIAVKIFSILGGVFILAGIFAYIASFWQDMGSFARVLITLGSGFAMYFSGVIFFRKSIYEAAVSPLLLAAVFFETGGLFVMIDEYFSTQSQNWRLACLIVFGVMLVQQALSFAAIRLPILLLTSLWAGASFFATAFDMLDISAQWNAVICGLSLFVIAYNTTQIRYRRVLQLVYIGAAIAFFSGMTRLFYDAGYYRLDGAVIGTSLLLTAYGLRSKLYQSTLMLFYLIAYWVFLYGWFYLLQGTMIEMFYIGISSFAVYFSVLVNSTLLLIIGVLSMLSYIGYFTAEHFVKSVGWPVALILLGILFFAISAAALRIKNRYMK